MDNCVASNFVLGFASDFVFGFKAVSGQMVNPGKSEIISVGVVDDIGDLALLLGCTVVLLPTSYLGLTLESSKQK